jgi:hypothetical protein
VARIVVSGYVVRYPLGGNVWAHLHYALGFHRLGHEVWFVEDSGGWDDSCYDPELGDMTSDPSVGLSVLGDVMGLLGMERRWVYRDHGGRCHGPEALDVDELIAAADLFVDVGGASYFPAMRRARCRAYVDMDPVFTQLGRFGGEERLAEYDLLFTYGANIGRSATVPTGGLRWRPLAPPVVLDLWERAEPAADGRAWTTVASLSSYGAVEHGGERYGQKDTEFLRLAGLPDLTPCRLELAADPDGEPETVLARHGWRVVDARGVSRDPWRYRAYVQSSRGELSVAKGAYVKARSGWLSDRTATYLASGRPAVVQDTGVPLELVADGGLSVFRTAVDAAAALERVEASYEAESRAARALAERHFDARKVLESLLADAL